jgi:hypothetical protein
VYAGSIRRIRARIRRRIRSRIEMNVIQTAGHHQGSWDRQVQGMMRRAGHMLA